MVKRIAPVLFMAWAAIFLVIAVAGCGSEEGDDTTASRTEKAPRTVVEEDPLQTIIDDLDKKAFTLEITDSSGFPPMYGLFPMYGFSPDGGAQGKYSQNGRGSWRADSASGSLIYNADEEKAWFIQENIAWELPERFDQYYPGGPAMSASPLSAILTMVPPRVGPYAQTPLIAGVDGVWEWDLSKPGPSGSVTVALPPMGATQAGPVGSSTGGGAAQPPSMTLRIEFKGPEGLLSRIVRTHPGGSQEQLFEYSNVGAVPEDSFSLPDNIEEVRIMPADGTPFPYMFGPEFGR